MHVAPRKRLNILSTRLKLFLEFFLVAAAVITLHQRVSLTSPQCSSAEGFFCLVFKNYHYLNQEHCVSSTKIRHNVAWKPEKVFNLKKK